MISSFIRLREVIPLDDIPSYLDISGHIQKFHKLSDSTLSSFRIEMELLPFGLENNALSIKPKAYTTITGNYSSDKGSHKLFCSSTKVAEVMHSVPFAHLFTRLFVTTSTGKSYDHSFGIFFTAQEQPNEINQRFLALGEEERDLMMEAHCDEFCPSNNQVTTG